MYKIRLKVLGALLSLKNLVDPAAEGDPFMKTEVRKDLSVSYRTYVASRVQTVKT